MTQFVVVGAGPAGCSAALRVARLQGAKVKVLEKRSFDSIFTPANNPRSYPMFLNGRSLRLFEELGADLPCTRVPFHGIETGKMTIKTGDPKRCALVTRSELAVELLSEAAAHPSISIHFGASPTFLDIHNKRLTLECTSSHADLSPMITDAVMHAQAAARPGSAADSAVAPVATLTEVASGATAGSREELSESLEYDFLVGADGTRSKVRDLLAEGGFLDVQLVFQKPLSCYKTFKDIGIPEGAKLPDSNAFPFSAPDIPNGRNLWFLAPKEESLKFVVAVWRSGPNTLSGVVIGQGGGSALDAHLTPDLLRDTWSDVLPEWFLQPFCDQLNQTESNGYGAIRKVSQFHAPSVVLLGDSAHSVTSSLGQGCNMALESVRVFGDVLEEFLSLQGGKEVSRGALEKVPEAFTARRRVDAQAFQRLELLNCLMTSKAEEEQPQVDLLTRLHARVALGATLMYSFAVWKLLPDKFFTLPFSQKLQDENVPFSDILAWMNTIGAVAYAAIVAVISAAGFGVWQALIVS